MTHQANPFFRNTSWSLLDSFKVFDIGRREGVRDGTQFHKLALPKHTGPAQTRHRTSRASFRTSFLTGCVCLLLVDVHSSPSFKTVSQPQNQSRMVSDLPEADAIIAATISQGSTVFRHPIRDNQITPRGTGARAFPSSIGVGSGRKVHKEFFTAFRDFLR